jgi:hypothetical protein
MSTTPMKAMLGPVTAIGLMMVPMLIGAVFPVHVNEILGRIVSRNPQTATFAPAFVSALEAEVLIQAIKSR